MPTTVAALILLAIFVTPGYLFIAIVRRIDRTIVEFEDSLSRVIASFACSVGVFSLAWAITRAISLAPQINVQIELINVFRDWVASNATQLFLSDRSVLEYIIIGFFLPIPSGMALGRLLVSGRIDGLLRYVGSDRSSLTSTAWDYHVYGRDHEAKVELSLGSGEILLGRLGSRSSIAAWSDGADLFLEPLEVTVSKDTNGDQLSEAGVWVSGKDIRWIKMTDVRGKN